MFSTAVVAGAAERAEPCEMSRVSESAGDSSLPLRLARRTAGARGAPGELHHVPDAGHSLEALEVAQARVALLPRETLRAQEEGRGPDGK